MIGALLMFLGGTVIVAFIAVQIVHAARRRTVRLESDYIAELRHINRHRSPFE